MRHLTAEIALRVATRLGFEVRDAGLLASAVARPQAGFDGVSVYPDAASQAAALLDSLARDHALVDGNKRLAWVLTQVFLEINGFETRATEDDAFAHIVGVAAGRIGLATSAAWFGERIARR